MDSSNKLKDIVTMGMMVAVLEVVKVALMTLPNIELVSLMIVLFTLWIGKKAFIVVTAFSLIECLLWGFGIWNIGYFYVWPILVVLTLFFRKQSSPLVWAIVLGFFGLFFGSLFALTNFVLSGLEGALSYLVSGLMFDVVHCISNFISTLVLFKPLNKIINKIK
jgi:energy-coupling factor transport system substrate-specific component